MHLLHHVKIVKRRNFYIAGQSFDNFDSRFSDSDVVGGWEEATLAQVEQAFMRYEAFGQSGQYTLAQSVDGEIEWVLSKGIALEQLPLDLRLGGELAEPTSLALQGGSGTVIGLNYAGEQVLAAVLER